ncbi:MAG: hypothetical protein Q4F95_10235 [Oscillospiraceae bacterium]|nr:hypothetical protein [Oscillospiraceae bacterium]
MKKVIYLLLICAVVFTSCGVNETSGLSESQKSLSADSLSDDSSKTDESETDEEIKESENIEVNNSLSDNEKEYENKVKQDYDNILKNITDKPLDDVISQSMPDTLPKNYLTYKFDPALSCLTEFISFNKQYNIELIRKLDDNRMYTVHKLDSGGLFYSFFNNDLLYNTAYACKKLSYSDFSDIKAGDSISRVEQIDPCTSMWRDINKDNGTINQNVLLTDGLLFINYKLQQGEYYIAGMILFDDFKMSVPSIDNGDIVFDYSILPEDYPE